MIVEDPFEIADAWHKRFEEQKELMGEVELFWAYLMEIKDLIEESDTNLTFDEIAGRMLWRATCEWDI